MKTEWISVKDELPEDGQNVLWCRVPVEEPYYYGSKIDDDFIEDYYTHWITAPEPPTQ